MYYPKIIFTSALALLIALMIYADGESIEIDSSLDWNELGDTMSMRSYLIHTPAEANYLMLQYGLDDICIGIQDGKGVLNLTEIQAAGKVKFSILDASYSILNSKLSYILSADENGYLTTWQSFPYLRANGQDAGQVVALPTDAYGNLLDEIPDVQLQFSTPQKLTIANKFQSTAFVSYLMNTPQSAGKIPVFLRSSRGYSRPIQFLVEAGEIAQAQLQLSLITKQSNGQEVVRYAVSDIKDRYGNELSDGQEIEIKCWIDETENTISAVSLNGRAISEIVLPVGCREIRAQVYTEGIAISNLSTQKLSIPSIEYDINITGNKLQFNHIWDRQNAPILDGTQGTLYLQGPNKNYKLTTESAKSSLQFGIADHSIDPGYYNYQLDILGQIYQGELKI